MDFRFFNYDFSMVCAIDLKVFPVDSAWKTGIETPISRSIFPTGRKLKKKILILNKNHWF
jgi:hypothetical protein